MASVVRLPCKSHHLEYLTRYRSQGQANRASARLVQLYLLLPLNAALLPIQTL